MLSNSFEEPFVYPHSPNSNFSNTKDHGHLQRRPHTFPVNGISNIWPSITRFGFDQTFRDPGLDLPSWANRFEVEYSNIWCDCLIWHRYLQNSWWPIISLIFGHKLTYSHSDWSVQTQMQQARRLDWRLQYELLLFGDIVKDVGNCGCGW